MFWNNVKQQLDTLGMTQKELAEKTGISIGTIRNQICREVIPDAVSAVKIARVLKTSVEYLVTGKDTHTKETAQAIDELKRLKHTLLKALSESSDYTFS